jgi:predicted transcriptional regulator of viral defense system
MSNKEHVMDLIKKNNGIITSREASVVGIDNKVLQRMNLSGEIERIEQGMYMDPNQIEDGYLIAQYRCRKGIFSHETALYFNDLSDRTPLQMMLTIPSGYNTRLLKEKDSYKFFYISEALHPVGVMEMLTPFGNKIRVYDRERTICDCIKKKNQLDGDMVTEAIKRYFKTPGADFAKLIEYSKMFKIIDEVRKYIEVLT